MQDNRVFVILPKPLLTRVPQHTEAIPHNYNTDHKLVNWPLVLHYDPTVSVLYTRMI